MTSSTNVLSLTGVTVKLEDQCILKEINLALEPDQIYTIIGQSGAGKTTLLKAIAGLVPLTSGQLSLHNRPFNPKETPIGLVPQHYGLLPWQTARQSVVEARKISRQTKEWTLADETLVNQLFTDMAIDSVKDKYPSEMSGGQQQRVSIARALGSEVDVLLLDEPFSALDAFSREQAQGLFLSTWQKQEKLALFITHDIEEALLLGHKIIVMTGQPGTVSQVLDNPFQGNRGSDRWQVPNYHELYEQLRGELFHHDK